MEVAIVLNVVLLIIGLIGAVLLFVGWKLKIEPLFAVGGFLLVMVVVGLSLTEIVVFTLWAMKGK
jgi:hypothetical protein